MRKYLILVFVGLMLSFVPSFFYEEVTDETSYSFEVAMDYKNKGFYERLKELEALNNKVVEKEEDPYITKEVLLEVSFYCGDTKTASGAIPTVGRTIACPPEVPFGSIVIWDDKELICEDRGGYIKKVWSDKHNDYLYRVDIFVATEEEAFRLGRYVTKGIIKIKKK